VFKFEWIRRFRNIFLEFVNGFFGFAEMALYIGIKEGSGRWIYAGRGGAEREFRRSNKRSHFGALAHARFASREGIEAVE
jgi:hypothetical protein